jgi:hypothetical protein
VPTKKKLYEAQVEQLGELDYLLNRIGVAQEFPRFDYRYASSKKQARWLFERIYPPESIIEIHEVTKEVSPR